MAEPCNCDHEHCGGDKNAHKHEGGEYVHPDKQNIQYMSRLKRSNHMSHFS